MGNLVKSDGPCIESHGAVQVYLSAYGLRYEIYTLNLVTFR